MCGGIVELGRVVDRQGSLDSLSYKELSSLALPCLVDLHLK